MVEFIVVLGITDRVEGQDLGASYLIHIHLDGRLAVLDLDKLVVCLLACKILCLLHLLRKLLCQKLNFNYTLCY